MLQKVLAWRTKVASATSHQSLAPSCSPDGFKGNSRPGLANIHVAGPQHPSHSVYDEDSSNGHFSPTPGSSLGSHGHAGRLQSDDESGSISIPPIDRTYVLANNHPFQSIRPELLQFSHMSMLEFMGETQRKSEARESRTGSNAACHPASLDGDEDEFIVTSHPGGRLACPFFICSSEEYGVCLSKNLRSMGDLVHHLQRHHLKPRYCPRCNETFGEAVDRDNHILQKKCELKDLEYRHGINEYQMATIVGSDKHCPNDEIRWYYIWSSIFPEKYPPESPYLDIGSGHAASVVRDFWDVYGRQCVSQVLMRRGEPGRNGDFRAQEALFQLALQDLVSKVVHEHEHC